LEKKHEQTCPRHKVGKRAEIKIDREEVVKVKLEELPADAESKGYETVVV